MHGDEEGGDGCGRDTRRIASLQHSDAHSEIVITALACNATNMLTGCSKGVLKVRPPLAPL